MSLPTDDKSYTVYKRFRNKRSSSGANIFTNLEKEKKERKKRKKKKTDKNEKKKEATKKMVTRRGR